MSGALIGAHDVRGLPERTPFVAIKRSEGASVKATCDRVGRGHLSMFITLSAAPAGGRVADPMLGLFVGPARTRGAHRGRRARLRRPDQMRGCPQMRRRR